MFSQTFAEQKTIAVLLIRNDKIMNSEFYSLRVNGNNKVWFVSLKKGKYLIVSKENVDIVHVALELSFFSQQGVLVKLATTISETLAYGIALLTDLVYKTACK